MTNLFSENLRAEADKNESIGLHERAGIFRVIATIYEQSTGECRVDSAPAFEQDTMNFTGSAE